MSLTFAVLYQQVCLVYACLRPSVPCLDSILTTNITPCQLACNTLHATLMLVQLVHSSMGFNKEHSQLCRPQQHRLILHYRAALRVKIRTRLGRLGSTIQQCWVLLQDLHQLSVVQGGHTGRARARRMEKLMRVSCQSLHSIAIPSWV